MSLLDVIFPKYCVRCKKLGSYVCDTCFTFISFNEHDVCVVCQRQTIDGRTHQYCGTRYAIDGVLTSLVYAGVVKKLIYQFKYKPYVKDLTNFLVDLFYEGLIQKETFNQVIGEHAVLVPVPLYYKKLSKRGYNQAALLAEGLAKRFDAAILPCLERIKNTDTQFRLSKDKREENIKDAFVFKTEFLGQLPRNAFLVDDIVTSGATLKEAAKVLKKAGVKKVWGLALAHGQ